LVIAQTCAIVAENDDTKSKNKNFELMLTRCAKAYGSSGSVA